MNNNKTLWVGMIVILVIAIIGIVRPNSVTNVIDRTVGSVVSLDNVDAQCYSIGGVQKCNQSYGLIASSSIIWTATVTATSTLEGFNCQGDARPLSVAQLFDVSTSSSKFAASSSPAYVRAFNTGTALFNAVWTQGGGTLSSTVLGNSADGAIFNVIKPGEWVTVRVATSSPSVFSGGYMTGTCKMTTRTL